MQPWIQASYPPHCLMWTVTGVGPLGRRGDALKYCVSLYNSFLEMCSSNDIWSMPAIPFECLPRFTASTLCTIAVPNKYCFGRPLLRCRGVASEDLLRRLTDWSAIRLVRRLVSTSPERNVSYFTPMLIKISRGLRSNRASAHGLRVEDGQP